MRSIGSASLAAFATILLMLSLPNRARAQTAMAFSAGPAEYDLSGTGWAPTGGAYVERSVRPWLRVEGGFGVFGYDTQFEESVLMLIPEAGIAFQAPNPFPIYLAVGAGHTLSVRGDYQDEPTLHGALGLSIAPSEEWRIRPEMRVRSVDPWVGTIAGFMVGVSKRIGG